MDIKYLQSFGITTTESKVYLEVAKLNETEIGAIIKKTGLHRGSVYNAVEGLIKKGFVSFIDREGHRFYFISGKKIFDTILSEKQKNIDGTKEKLNSLFDELLSNRDLNKKQEVEVFYGVSAFKNLFLEMFDECKKNDFEYLFQGRGGEMQDTTGESFYKDSQKLKRSMKIRCRILLDKSTAKHNFNKYISGNLRYISSDIKSPVNFWIYGDTTLIVIFGATPLVSIKIKSKLLSDGFRSYFEKLWSMAK
jgi:DNA-binding MarR family transcriptional regulator